ncbi:SWIM zinc finger family protein [Cerasicoccus maritimus]|uniref:SWIM zinc finger family protein n=1 Tax=Cerasicoccus maritimus TaxID=490089 RepID=UPI002852BDDD|nr:SWIM zinc finger family protein [Cerasicoccus maritimus]
MKFDYQYHGSSSVSNSASGTGMNFVPDATREPTFFRGELSHKLPFREAISALHDVVVSDLRWNPKGREDYKAWAKEQEDIWLAEALAEGQQAQARMNEVHERIGELNKQRAAVLRPFYDARQKYYSHLYRVNKDWWFVLDPVITVHPDCVFFECFSQDESTYGRLACKYDVFQNVGEFACGTTNIDYSDSLYQEFQKIRGYKATQFAIDPSGFEAKTEGEDAYKEVKIDLPDSWVRGFLQVSSAMTLPAAIFELHPMDVHNICFVLRRHKEKLGPRSLRFILKPGQPVTLRFDPWNYEVRCPRSIYHGSEETEVRIWGRRRLLTLQRLVPVAKRFTVRLLGYGMPSFFEADLGNMIYTLGISGWTANDWSHMGNFDLMAPRKDVDQYTTDRVYEGLKATWFASADDLASRLGLERDVVLGALSLLTQAGRVIFDAHEGVYRVRELSREPLTQEQYRYANEREARANELVAAGAAQVWVEDQQGRKAMKGRTNFGGRVHETKLTIDADERIVVGQCSCNFFQQNALRKGPCEHMLALRIAHQRKA